MNKTLILFISFLYFLLLFSVYFVYIGGDKYFTNYVQDYSLRLHADSVTYTEMANVTDEISIEALIRLDGNFFGPVLLLKLLAGNHFLVLLFNIFLLLTSVYSMYKVIPSFDIYIFGFWMYINAMLFFSLLVVNKEIFAISAFFFFCSYLFSRKILFLLLALFLSFLSRWQFSVVILLSVLLITFNFWGRLLVILAQLSISSFLLGYYPDFTDAFYIAGLMGKEANTNSGLINTLNELQKEYYYWLIFPLRVLSQMVFPFFSIIFSFSQNMLNWENNFYNVIVVPLASLSTIILAIVYFIKRKITLKNDFIYICLLFSISFAFTPFSSYRYFYPVYVILALNLSLPFDSLKKNENLSLHSII